MNAPTEPLFRPEVAEARRQRLLGEIVLAQPVGVRAMVLLLSGAMALVVTWIALGTYTRSESARGVLVTDAASAKVVAMRPGQVTQLLVRDGDIVRAGQQLATIRVEQTNEAGESSIAGSLSAIDSQHELTEQQVQLSGLRASAERARLGATFAGLAQQRANLSDQIALQREFVGSAKDSFERVQSVAEKAFVSRIEVERRRQAWLGAQLELSRLNQQFSASTVEENRARAELARVAADAATEVASVQTSAQSLAQQRAQLQGERAYTVTAPIAGRVTALQVAAGRTVDASVPLMIIIPERSTLHADVYAPSRAIGFVKEGQEVRLLYDAFPYQRFGSFTGRIARISRIVVDPGELSASLKIEEPVYRIEVTPERQTVDAFGDRLMLQPGMTVTANILLDRRSFLDWLLLPLNAVTQRNQ